VDDVAFDMCIGAFTQTIGVDFSVKVVNIPNTNAAVELYLFDSAGQSVFNQRELGTKHVSMPGKKMLIIECI
jgi:hypothetical protein